MSERIIEKKIRNFVRKFFIKSLLEDKFKNHNNISNVMITAYFNKTMHNIKSENNEERQKFFFAFRTKYIDDFKRNRKLFTTLISNFKQRKAFKEFKAKFVKEEWDKINGDKIAKYLALREKTITTEDFEYIFDLIRIIDK